MYANQAREGDSEAFHGAGFPAPPLPGPAGILASSLGFDRDDVAVSLETALILLSAVVAQLPDASDRESWRPCADCLAPDFCETATEDLCP
jgi:hypothetical protein